MGTVAGVGGFGSGGSESAVEVQQECRRHITPGTDRFGGGFLRVFADAFADVVKNPFYFGCGSFAVVIADENIRQLFRIFIRIDHQT